jgi:hypothetical protein
MGSIMAFRQGGSRRSAYRPADELDKLASVPVRYEDLASDPQPVRSFRTDRRTSIGTQCKVTNRGHRPAEGRALSASKCHSAALGYQRYRSCWTPSGWGGVVLRKR